MKRSSTCNISGENSLKQRLQLFVVLQLLQNLILNFPLNIPLKLLPILSLGPINFGLILSIEYQEQIQEEEAKWEHIAFLLEFFIMHDLGSTRVVVWTSVGF